MKPILLNERQACDLEMILNGGFYPLKGFMNHDNYHSVVDNMRLADGTIWTIPITLAVPKNTIMDNHLLLAVGNVKNLVAKLLIEEIYEPDLLEECQKVYGTTDTNHPYVNYVLSDPDIVYVGGKVISIKQIEHYSFRQYRLEPYQVKDAIRSRGWDRTVGFQCRNPIHNSHYTLTKISLESVDSSNKGLLIQPVVGVTQPGDVDPSVRIRCYEEILNKYKSDNIPVILSLIPLSMRMAGPREAIWHAMIRFNYGCTDFIVGRSHSSPSTKTIDGHDFYETYEAHELVDKLHTILPINIIKSNPVADQTKTRQISGSAIRRMLKAGEPLPEWYTIPTVKDILADYYSRGICIYIIGLSGSGKSTVSKALVDRLGQIYSSNKITLLDGDEIRNNFGQVGFDKDGRSFNVRRIGCMASLLVKTGGIVVCASVAPYDEDRIHNRGLIEKVGGKYYEIYLNTGLDVCEQRDVKGLYKKVRNGEIDNFIGIHDKFELPSRSDLVCTGEGDINSILNMIISVCKIIP